MHDPHLPFAHARLLNGSVGDPLLYIDFPDADDAVLFDAGENGALSDDELADLTAVFLTHHHVDHFVGFDRIVRANIDSDKILSVFGPVGTIQKSYDRIRSYEYQFFPFQKITLKITEVDQGVLRTGWLECRKRFPPPEITETVWNGEPIFEGSHYHVEAGHLDHTVPCLGYSLTEREHDSLNRELLESGPLRPGPWVSQVLQALRNGTIGELSVEIQGGKFSGQKLADLYFRREPGAKLAYIVDTAWSDLSRPVMMKLAQGADQLFCDSFYAEADAKSAEKHRHMTARRAAQLARDARVKHLTLIHFSKRYAGRYDKLVEEARSIFPKTTAEFG